MKSLTADASEVWVRVTPVAMYFTALIFGLVFCRRPKLKHEPSHTLRQVIGTLIGAYIDLQFLKALATLEP